MSDDTFEIEPLQPAEPDPRRFDPRFSYGIIPEQPKDDDVLYRLSYDADKGFLLLHSFVVQTFKWESNADVTFQELFRQEGVVKTVDVHRPANATVIVNNIKMPLALRNAFFRTGSDGHRLQLTSEITRARAKKFGVNQAEVDEYIAKCRDQHYKLREDNKRK